ncbi:hypothetical protein MM440_16825 [Arsenicicoccus piscis]|uniref:DUF4190 domain-containing protein n=1 Tax=Arsenicicoccus piscis TaxID=673954 RepID=A0ABQ6HQ31_9MICO|nr:hypothetical protein [Arsenicicoccus piscis]MCH8628162.1 hypothetical protein [Arsenicicoccus piscis]MCH8629388.1 hypothetical protein [Arsenicicoccus piscis]GMA20457.1 hypothetical protein GCM10025862_24780 [Arsenicicoccus piscis]
MPDKPVPTPPAGARDSSRCALLVLVGLVLTYLPLPWRALAVVAGLAAIFFGIRAMTAQIRTKQSFSAAWTGLGVMLAAWLIVVTGIQTVFTGQWSQVEECLKGANTRVAEADCRKQLGDGAGSGLLGLFGE